MGSRYGGLKQIEPVGPNGEFIIDYSIYDAKRAGFNKVVFIIKEENYEVFKETIGRRIENKIDVEYAFQKQNDIPTGYSVPEERTKPWGTSHAILCTKNLVKGDFAVINADDFYGKESYEVISDFFKNRVEDEYLLVGYKVENTLSENGAAKRGVCDVENGYLKILVESSVERKNGMITAIPIDGSPMFTVKEDNVVSMNMFGFTDELFNYLEKDLQNFFEKNKENLEKCERLIPEVVCDMVKDKVKRVKVVPTVAKWQGITYREDKQVLIDEISSLIKQGVYPEKL